MAMKLGTERIVAWIVGGSILLSAAFIGGGLVGQQRGQRAGEMKAQVVAQSRSERDQKILRVIVKRNPSATVREFLRLPEYLVGEAERLNLSFLYVMAIIDRESEWKPSAVSPKGAIGLMQVMPDTARLVVDKLKLPGFDAPVPARGGGYVSLGSLGEPEFNLRIGMQFLRWQLDDFGLGPTALRAYNRGPARALEQWPNDTYSAEVAQRLLVLVHEVR